MDFKFKVISVILTGFIFCANSHPNSQGGSNVNQITNGQQQLQYQQQTYPNQYVTSPQIVYPTTPNFQQAYSVNTQPTYKQIAVNPQEFQRLYQNALKAAWEEYGPKQRAEPTSGQHPNPSQYAHRDTGFVYTNNQMNGFQPWESEWDTHVTPQPISSQAPQPTIFNRLLSSYIDFEVNNHELADFLRRAVGFALVGVLVAAWIGVGVYFGLFPLKWLYFLGLGKKRDLEALKNAEGRLEDDSNSLMSELTERIFLALDGDWLRKLEERVQKNGNRNWLKTHVQCCILPDAKTKGMADCQYISVKRGKKLSTFKCLSDLIYNFQFGPNDKSKSSENF